MINRRWQLVAFLCVSIGVAGGMMLGSDARSTALAGTGGNNPGNTGDDRFAPNGSKAIVDARTGDNNPKLGRVTARRDINNLALSAADNDWFRFTTTRQSGPTGFLRVQVLPWNRRIRLVLRNNFGVALRSSLGTAVGTAPFPDRARLVRVPFANQAGGTYYAHINDNGLGNSQTLRNNSTYNLVIDPAFR